MLQAAVIHSLPPAQPAAPTLHAADPGLRVPGHLGLWMLIETLAAVVFLLAIFIVIVD